VTGGTVPATATAAVLNVTAVDPTAAGYLTVYPQGGTLPVVSSVNFAAGSRVANAVTVGLGSTGMATIFNNTGSTNVVVDVDGYYTTTPASAGSGLYNALSPVRVFGTLANGATVGANSTTAVTVTGGSVPTAATAVVANVTAAGATAPSYLSVYPAGATPAVASSLNFTKQVANQAIANRVTVGVGTNGQIDVYNLSGSVRVDVDIDGYYSAAAGTGSQFVPITPIRVADTRTATSVGTETPIAPSTTESFNLSTGAIPTGSGAVASNFTVVPGNDPGYLTVYPTSTTTEPVASDVNWTANEYPAVPNFTIADTAGTGSVNVYNSHGATINLLVDDFGYFTPSTTVPPTSSLYAISAEASPTSIPANGTSTSTVTATVSGQDSAPVDGDTVQFTLTGTGCGTITGSSTGGVAAGTQQEYVPTGATGTATITYTSSLTFGACTVDVQEADAGLPNSTTITQTQVGYGITLAANPAVLVAGGTNPISVLTAAVTFDGAPAVGDFVRFVVGAENPLGTCGTVPTVAGTPGVETNSSGDAVVDYSGGATEGFCPITATEQTTHAAATTSVTQKSPISTADVLDLAATPSTIPADGTTDSAITAAVTGAGGSPIDNDPVMFQFSGASCSSLTTLYGATTGAGGPAAASYTASTTAGVCTVTATEAFGGASNSTSITQGPVIYSVAVTATPPTITANGLSTSTITATVTNTFGDPAPGDTVTFTIPNTYPGPHGAFNGGVATLTAITNAQGVATVTYTSSTTAGFSIVKATESATGGSGTASIDQTAV
jgi:hypothetical protein